jgi:hypothetical protein
MSEIKNCPFCGKDSEWHSLVDMRGIVKWSLQCANIDCEMRPYTEHYEDKNKAVTVWNTRTYPEEVKGLVRVCRSLIDKASYEYSLPSTINDAILNIEDGIVPFKEIV